MLRRYSEYKKAKLVEFLRNAETHTEAVDALLDWMKIELTETARLPMNLFENASVELENRYNICVKKDFQNQRDIFEAYVLCAKHVFPKLLEEADMATIGADIDRMVDELGDEILRTVAQNRNLDVEDDADDEEELTPQPSASSASRSSGTSSSAPHVAHDDWGDDEFDDEETQLSAVSSSSPQSATSAPPVSKKPQPASSAPQSSPSDPSGMPKKSVWRGIGNVLHGAFVDPFKKLGRYFKDKYRQGYHGVEDLSQIGDHWTPQGRIVLENIQNLLLENGAEIKTVLDDFKVRLKDYLNQAISGASPSAAASSVVPPSTPATATTPSSVNPSMDTVPKVGPEADEIEADALVGDEGDGEEMDRNAMPPENVPTEAPPTEEPEAPPASRKRYGRGGKNAALNKAADAIRMMQYLGITPTANEDGTYNFGSRKKDKSSGSALRPGGSNPLGLNAQLARTIQNKLKKKFGEQAVSEGTPLGDLLNSASGHTEFFSSVVPQVLDLLKITDDIDHAVSWMNPELAARFGLSDENPLVRDDGQEQQSLDPTTSDETELVRQQGEKTPPTEEVPPTEDEPTDASNPSMDEEGDGEAMISDFIKKMSEAGADPNYIDEIKGWISSNVTMDGPDSQTYKDYLLSMIKGHGVDAVVAHEMQDAPPSEEAAPEQSDAEETPPTEDSPEDTVEDGPDENAQEVVNTFKKHQTAMLPIFQFGKEQDLSDELQPLSDEEIAAVVATKPADLMQAIQDKLFEKNNTTEERFGQDVQELINYRKELEAEAGEADSKKA